MTISFEAPYYNFIKYETVETVEEFHKFQNMMIGEFDLYQKEEQQELKVYFPNGWFVIKMLYENENNINLLISIKSKTLKSGKVIEAKIKSIYRLFDSIMDKKENVLI